MYDQIGSSHGSQPDRKKKVWSQPVLTVSEISSAEGAVQGPLCDKHGSLSKGGNCP